VQKALVSYLNFDSVLWAITLLFAATLIYVARLQIPSDEAPARASSSPLKIVESVTARPIADVRFETTSGYVESLAQTDGHVRIVTTFYSHCPGACPLAFDSLRRIEGTLPPAQRRKLRIVALTLDPERDTRTQLRSFEQDRGLDTARWTLGRASARDTAGVANALGASLRVLDDGTVDHLSSFILLDKRGKEIARTSKTQSMDAQFAAAVRAALGA
jgi:protein SCO1/2